MTTPVVEDDVVERLRKIALEKALEQMNARPVPEEGANAEKRGEEKIKTRLRRLGYELGDDALYVVSRHRIVNVD